MPRDTRPKPESYPGDDTDPLDADTDTRTDPYGLPDPNSCPLTYTIADSFRDADASRARAHKRAHARALRMRRRSP